MINLNPEVSYFNESIRADIGADLIQFLDVFTGLSVIDIPGIDNKRTRVLTTLIHGNEPSGFIACYEWLKSGLTPATNVRILICNPEAASTKPVFTHRYIDLDKDLNRYFGHSNQKKCVLGVRAGQIQALIEEVKPEAVIDIHNTSGSGPAFGVSISDSKGALALVNLFASKVILTELKVGALMELEFNAPIVTIECGGAKDSVAHQIAYKGIQQFFALHNLFSLKAPMVKVYRQPVRVQLKNNASVGFAKVKLPTASLTMRLDIELLNSKKAQKNEFLGWYDETKPIPISALDQLNQDHTLDLFRFEKGSLLAKQDLQVFMATTLPDIATNDCLFYVTLG
ncbi:hypothetical protein ACUR5C_02810 [Aliikangiella sp. IMCC44653]